MKLVDHVDKIRKLIESAFDKQFAQLGIGKNKKIDIEKIATEVRPSRLRLEEMLENHIEEIGNYEDAREMLIDELAFTLFNRIAALKVMEAATLFMPVITKQAEHGDRSFGHKAWLEINPHMRSEELEGIRDYLKHAFDELSETLFLYSKTYPYAMLPDAISLNEIIEAFNEVEKDSQVGSDIWESDDVLGWMYESYNEVKKKAHKDSGDKTEYDKVSLQSQVYTPSWVVQFLVENSLGKLYLEMYPNSEIKNRYKIANAPQVKEREIKSLTDIKVIDPACGSGNFLTYAFDFFYELYIDQIENYGADYNEKDIPKLIIEKNLHGIDLDNRAVQLAQLGLFIKAKKKHRMIGELTFNVVSSNFFLPEYEEVEHIFNEGNQLDDNQKKLIADVWSDLQHAYKFGSLIRLDEKLKSRISELQNQIDSGDYTLFTSAFIEEEKSFAATFFTNLKTAVEKYGQAKGNTFLTKNTRDAITFLELLTTEYDVATANPPYTDSANFGPELKKFIDNNYKKPYKFHTNLYGTFIKRCYDFINETGFIAMVNPPTFMYIKSFEDVRKFIIDKTHVNLFVEWGYLGMFNPSARVDSALYILEKGVKQKKDSAFIKLNNLYETKRYDALFEAFEKLLTGSSHELLYTIPQDKLKIIESWPFIYWISDEFREKFTAGLIGETTDVRAGIQTSNNNRFLRFWWEVNPEDILKEEENPELDKKWVRYSKGGPYQKWFGNLWLIIDWERSGEKLRDFLISKGQDLHAEDYYYKQGLTYSASGSKGISLRYLPKNHLFDIGGSSVFLTDDYQNTFYLMGLLNSKIAFYITSSLNPTVNKQPGDLKRIPFVNPKKKEEDRVTELSTISYLIKNKICEYSIVESDFKTSPYKGNDSLKYFLNYENHLLTQVLINEAIIDENIFEVHDLTEHDKAMVLAKEGESIGGLPILSEARDAYLFETEASKEFPLDGIQSFIESLPIKEFSIEERKTIEESFPSLYQSNNDLEDFCIRNKVNPINVWYWFKQSGVVPQQRMKTLAFEFLVDIVREILMDDEDGIIPVVSNAGEKVLLDRIEEKFRENDLSQRQYSNFHTVLGYQIDEYLNKHFFVELSNHLNLFMYLPKTPFIWHLSSGPEQGFDCYIIIYKWSRDKLMQLRSVYIEHRERSLINRQSDLTNNESAEAQSEKDLIFRQLIEIKAFKVKIDELLAEGYNPILDDGVGKNIAPLQKKGMITNEVLTPGQLKKYLNADW